MWVESLESGELRVELSTGLPEISQCPEKAPTWAAFLLEAPTCAFPMKNPSPGTVTFREVPSTALVESVPVNQDQTADSLESPGMFSLINMSQVSARCSVTKLNFFRLPQLLN